MWVVFWKKPKSFNKKWKNVMLKKLLKCLYLHFRINKQIHKVIAKNKKKTPYHCNSGVAAWRKAAKIQVLCFSGPAEFMAALEQVCAGLICTRLVPAWRDKKSISTIHFWQLLNLQSEIFYSNHRITQITHTCIQSLTSTKLFYFSHLFDIQVSVIYSSVVYRVLLHSLTDHF